MQDKLVLSGAFSLVIRHPKDHSSIHLQKPSQKINFSSQNAEFQWKLMMTWGLGCLEDIQEVINAYQTQESVEYFHIIKIDYKKSLSCHQPLSTWLKKNSFKALGQEA